MAKRDAGPDPARELDEESRVGAAVRMYSGMIVKRGRLVQEVLDRCNNRGIALVCAPSGFGKTALLLQCVSSVQSRTPRGEALLIDAGRMREPDLERRLEELERTVPDHPHALVAIDDVPRLSKPAAARVAQAFSRLVESGYRILAACTPSARSLVNALGEDALVSAQELTVQPREYSEWARTLSIAHTLDVYRLTQGIPLLVSLLQSATAQRYADDLLEAGVAELYRAILRDLRRDRDAMYRPVCLMLLVGSGSLEDFKRFGIRMRPATLARIERDLPAFGIDHGQLTFRCLGHADGALARVRREVAQRRPEFAADATRMLMENGRVDAAVELCRLVMSPDETLALVERYPVQMALAGYGSFVLDLLARKGSVASSRVPTGVLLAAHAAALTLGDYRTARSSAQELAKRSGEQTGAAPSDWERARAVAEVWGSVTGAQLPAAPEGAEQAGDVVCNLLRAHVAIYRALVAGDGEPSWTRANELAQEYMPQNAVDVPQLLLRADRAIDRALHGDGIRTTELDQLEDAVDTLAKRRLLPVASRVRMAVNIVRLYAGDPVTDERGFVDAGTTAVRESDLATQLFCMAAEGWQSLAQGQAANARFRGQQVLRLCAPGQEFLAAWGQLLERTAYLRGTSHIQVREDADSLDLTQERCAPVTAWTVALHLSAARFDSELSAWYSLHKSEMLDTRFRPLARQAMAMLGGRVEPIRHLLPQRVAVAYTYEDRLAVPGDALFETMGNEAEPEVGHVVICLFGGFRVERNGHALTDTVWRRKKASVLAARLALANGAFVSRRTVVDELWPDMDYGRGRENLYVTLSSLRAALHQRPSGPQYLLVQADGLALNGEYVHTDVQRFDALAREVLLQGDETSMQKGIEACLKLEQLYRGPLYVPDCGDPSFFVQMRRALANKFVDCMVRGTDLAVQADNLPCASWLIEAALRQMPTREDVIRRTMVVYDRCGRHREVVDLYNGHLHYLQHELDALPEEETRRLYEQLIEASRTRPDRES